MIEQTPMAVLLAIGIAMWICHGGRKGKTRSTRARRRHH